MRYGAKIGLVLVAVGVLPVALLGLVSYVVSRDEVQRTVGRMQTQAAEDLALFVERTVTATIENLRLSAAALPLEDSSGFARWEIAKMLAIPYRQLPFVSILAIVDDAKVPVAGPAFERRPERDPALAGREPVGPEDLELFSSRIPAPPAAVGGTTMSEPYRAARGPLRVAIAHRLAPDRSIVAEVVLRDVEARLGELSRGAGIAYLVDSRGAPLAHGSGPGAAVTEDERRLANAGAGAEARVVERADGQRWLAAFAPVRRYGWGAVVAQPASLAFGAAERLRFYTLAWAAAALCLAAALGTLLARRVTLPVQRLSRAAGAIAAGEWGAEVDTRGNDEIGDLGRAFSRMTQELRRRDEEIRAFNEELQGRVEQRTAELRAAQDQILRTRRLAALGSLGAGLAHELNNPMTAITGYLAILRKNVVTGTVQDEMVARAQEQAGRVSRIVEDLRSFADQERQTSGQRFSLGRTVDAALSLYEDRIRASGITLSRHIEDRLPEAQGDPVQIQQVVAHLVENAINAMASGGKLEVELGTVDGDALRLRISDTGKGIPATIRDRIFDPFFTTKGQAGQVGLGLSVSHSIVEAHHGRIVVDSEEGAGAAVTVLLPAAASAHLA
jgi:two-component system NtrC family sensor kinase